MKNKLVFVAMLAMILALGMTVVGCKDEPDNNNDNGDGYIKGWPNNTVLADYGISGLTQPAGATAVEYIIRDEGASNGGTRTKLFIGYKGTNSDGEEIRTWFNSQNDWTRQSSNPNNLGFNEYRKGTNTNTSGNVYYEADIGWLFGQSDGVCVFDIYKTVW